jgi:pimeloyl-ACP methyl ester carboxylesterase
MDILSFHSIDHIAGIINIAGATYISDRLLPELGSSFAFECIQGLMFSSSVDTFQKAAGDFIDGCCRTLPYDVRQRCLGSIMTQPQGAMRRSFTRPQDQGIFEETGKTSLPCLVIYGDKDELVLVGRLPGAYRSWKNVTIEVVEGGSHVPWSETDKPAAKSFNEKMLRWINRIICSS